jgi:outer membrane murein-binding lipoprotein Lpp
MTNSQLYLAIGIPMLFNAVLVGILIAYINAKVDMLGTRIDGLEARVDSLDAHLNQRLDDLRDLWRAELHRVEEFLDTRLKHLEGR